MPGRRPSPPATSSAPHPRANVAEVLVRAGRRGGGEAIYADLHRQCPEDIWLRNSAGLTYAEVGDHASALTWLDEGVAMALADGDAEHILDQLNGQRNRSRESLGLGPDDLASRAAAFDRDDPARPRPGPSPGPELLGGGRAGHHAVCALRVGPRRPDRRCR